MGNILLACIVQIHAQEQATTHASKVQESVESLVRTLFLRKVKGWIRYCANLDTTVFGKPSHLEIPHITNVPDVLECSEPGLGLVNRMRFNLLDGSLKGLGLRNLNSEISRLGKSGRWWEAFQVFKAIKQQGLQPNVFIYTSMIGAFGRGKQPE